MDNREKWERLGQLLRRQRVVVLGYKSRTAFARHLGLGSDRVLYDLESARRDNYDIDTLLSLETWYGVSSAEIREALGDLYPLHDIASRSGPHSIQSVRSGQDQTLDELQRSVDEISAVLVAMRNELDRLRG